MIMDPQPQTQPQPQPQQLVTTLHDLEQVFLLMQKHSIGECTFGELVIRARQVLPEPIKKALPVSDMDILANPYAGLDA